MSWDIWEIGGVLFCATMATLEIANNHGWLDKPQKRDQGEDDQDDPEDGSQAAKEAQERWEKENNKCL